VQIFQSRDQVALLNEMVHNVRTVPLDNRPHVPKAVRQWVGDPAAVGTVTRSWSRRRTSLATPRSRTRVRIFI
jgi:hypothetical protein